MAPLGNASAVVTWPLQVQRKGTTSSYQAYEMPKDRCDDNSQSSNVQGPIVRGRCSLCVPCRFGSAKSWFSESDIVN
jgi:hypothetical protein